MQQFKFLAVIAFFMVIMAITAYFSNGLMLALKP